jgi:hypothetical protein
MRTIYRIKVLLCLPICISFLIACSKEENRLPPVISLKTGSGYTQNNAVVQVGHGLYFGLQARGNKANITNLTIKKVLDDHTVITMMDTGMNAAGLDINKVFYQNIEPKATWLFTVMDRNRMTAEISLVVYKDSNSAYGGIYYFPSIKMGYQLNTTYGHFLDLSTGKVYSEDSATLFHEKIEILTYYILDGTPSPVLSSPGEMDNFSTDAKTYYPCIISWPVRRFTLWDISVDDTPVPTAVFDNAQNDSLLIVSYHEVWGKKKFKWATAGKIIPFLTASGKKGLIKVISADITDTGMIEFAIKIQQ